MDIWILADLKDDLRMRNNLLGQGVLWRRQHQHSPMIYNGQAGRQKRCNHTCIS